MALSSSCARGTGYKYKQYCSNCQAAGNLELCAASCLRAKTKISPYSHAAHANATYLDPLLFRNLSTPPTNFIVGCDGDGPRLNLPHAPPPRVLPHPHGPVTGEATASAL
eukprot:scaffold41704_cov31-Tisochrysis_lutea.AAC.4